jgi:nucleoside-diphosphate-sugar epimerase
MIGDAIVVETDLILITGSNGFIGSKVVESLLSHGFANLRCLVRPSSNLTVLNKVISGHSKEKIQIFKGNLLSREDCERMTEGVSVIYHLAAGRGVKSYPDAYLNSVVVTRNLLEAVLKNKDFRRFVNVSSFSVYSNYNVRRGGLLDETCEVEGQPALRGDAYCYAKVNQDKLVMNYDAKYEIPYVIVRPGVVYGPGNKGIHGRVGIGTFGIFLHLGGSNKIPLSYVDNCAEAIVLAGVKRGVDREVFNVVDDDLPTSKEFLRMYKKNVRRFRSLYIPYRIWFLFCCLWEKYSSWSDGQLPPVYNRKMCANYWKGNRYSNQKLKKVLNWTQKVNFDNGVRQYLEYQRTAGGRK